MISKRIITISRIIEITIIYIVFLIIYFKAFKRYSPGYLLSQKSNKNDLISLSHKENNSNWMNNYLVQLVKNLFNDINSKFYFIFEIFNNIFKSFSNSLNEIRNLTKPIRIFFKNIAKEFYSKLANIMIAVTYSLHKIRNSLRRSVSGFNMAFHSLNHIYYSLENILNSPIPKITQKFIGATDWLDGAFNKLGLCFWENTVIKTQNGYKKISEIKIGEFLEDDNQVIATQVFLCNCKMYKYQNIIVSGSHLVKEENTWKRIYSSNKSIEIPYTYKYIYCLSTSTGTININNIIFKDYSESIDINLNTKINKLILKNLNSTKNIVNHPNIHYSQQGVSSNTLVKINNNQYKKIENIEIGDILCNNNKVIGKIQILSKYNKVFTYKNKWLLLDNTKINENGIWIKVIDSLYSKINLNQSNKFFNLVTTKSIFELENNLLVTDYIETHDLETNNKIDSLNNI